jgi:hypothetical protein
MRMSSEIARLRAGPLGTLSGTKAIDRTCVDRVTTQQEALAERRG